MNDRRLQLRVRGVVQGVGFRPWVARLAARYRLGGFVANRGGEVVVEVEGSGPSVAEFLGRLTAEAPPPARIDAVDLAELAPRGERDFRVAPSGAGEQALALPPDTAPCSACRAEFADPADRRYRYPFISCTGCGPRWSILTALPYDRSHTSFAAHPLCDACEAEYREPGDRRFHHQATSCPRCGPRVRLVDPAGTILGEGDAAFAAAAEALAAGRILAFKSVGGYQLLVDARDAGAVARLRARKGRPAKPLAVLFPDLAEVERHARLDAGTRDALLDRRRPIVLLPSRASLPDAIAPGLAWLGAMLPPSAVHDCLFAHLRFPLVATSGNRSGEPLCHRDDQALARLGGVADLFLLHDLAVQHPLDDSVVRVIGGQAVVLRAGRGFAPVAIPAERAKPGTVALGGHLKASVAVSAKGQLLLGPHVGDLESGEAEARLIAWADWLVRQGGGQMREVVCDLHPDLGAVVAAARLGLPQARVQHHAAHLGSLLAEWQDATPLLALLWDGAGFGSDGTIWGGECCLWDGRRLVRVGHLHPFPLVGGEAAIREPRRVALALLRVAGAAVPPALESAFAPGERALLERLLEAGSHCIPTTSAGRLFDGVAALLGLCHRNRYEGEAALRLEGAAEEGRVEPLPMPLVEVEGRLLLDWRPLVRALVAGRAAGEPVGRLAAAFHEGLAAAVTAVAERFGDLPVGLSGGVFQNRRLAEAVCRRLGERGRPVLFHRRVPPNDGGLALGQLWWAIKGGDGDVSGNTGTRGRALG
ncbi:MAG: carbamoyltransferase HypF [Porticoccaceae bacterium]|nr:MAG: carbamoyltransferase HypF [Porticoccaceae bacterium]